MNRKPFLVILMALLACALAACTDAPDGLAVAQPADTTVVVDFQAKPLPNIPLPNDLATRFDSTSPTLRRINASLIAPTAFETLTRENIDMLDGWGVFAPITVGFSGLIDLKGLQLAHSCDNYDLHDDQVYLVDITPGSPTYGKPALIDIGQGNFPVVLKDRAGYWENDPRGDTLSLFFDETDEDINKNGKLDEGEDTDLDGVLDRPNYLPQFMPEAGTQTGAIPAPDTVGLPVCGNDKGYPASSDLARRANALMYWYERETNTLIMRPLTPLRQRTTYAVVVTRRLKDANGKPVGSPFPTINHTAQTEALAPLKAILAANPPELGGLQLADVAFTWSFSTGTIYDDLTAVRNGLYGQGPQAYLQDSYPPEMSHVWPVWDAAAMAGTPPHNLFVVPGEKMTTIMRLIAGQVQDANIVSGPVDGDRLYEGLQYVDYHVFGSFDSPQLFPRLDADGNYLNYGQMIWPPDVSTTPAPSRAERVSYWLAIPRKEASPRKDGKPAGLVIIGHGYTGNKLTTVQFAGYFARYGIATLCLENVSHGFDLLHGNDLVLAKALLDSMGLTGVVDALFQNRSWDQDLDGQEDSGADFWTAYTFHTRDVVRQSTVDYMQLIRILRSYDGSKKWPFDANNNGKTDDDIAGDFDGDGKVDIGGKDSVIGITGSSLGGMMSAMLGGSEPQVAASIPVCAGGGLGDVGVRSLQGGVREAVILRVMGPLYTSAVQPDGSAVVNTVVPRLNSTARIQVATLPAEIVAQAGAVLARSSNGEYDCGLVTKGLFRVGLPSDVTQVGAQTHTLTFYQGNPFQTGVRDDTRGKACTLKQGAVPIHTIAAFGNDVKFAYDSRPLAFQAGDPLSPLAEGLGLHRARPELRKFMGLAQMVLDPADPAVLAKQFTSGEAVMATGEVVNTHGIVITTIGDMNVPASTGASIARNLGKIDWFAQHPEWNNRSALQMLADTHMLEAVNVIGRYLTPAGAPVMWDVEDLSESATLTAAPTAMPYPLGYDGYWAPRLTTPLHKYLIGNDGHGGIGGAFFPYVRPEGKHDLDFPGEQTDRITTLCANPATANAAPCKALAAGAAFDHGALVLEGMIQFLGGGGKAFPLAPCQSDWSCAPTPGQLNPADMPCDRSCSGPTSDAPWMKKCSSCP